MPHFSIETAPEAFVSTSATSQLVVQAVAAGKLRKLGSRLYTKNLSDPAEAIVRRNWYYLVNDYYPDALIADRTALENKPAADGSVFIISNKKRPIELPGLTFKPRKGPAALESDLPFAGGARLSSTARAFLENIQPSRSRDGSVPRTLTKAELEERLDTIIRNGGDAAANQIRDNARAISAKLGLHDEYKKLDELIGRLLGTRDGNVVSPIASARVAGKPYDPDRITLFETLFTELRNTAPSYRPAKAPSPQENANLSFFEAYFSNFIEGTEFEVEEAIDVVFNGRIPQDRPEDAHDVLGTYRIAADRQALSTPPQDFEHFIRLLCQRHHMIMESRPDKLPGQFKVKTNRAGSTVFVAPDLVLGTIEKGYGFYEGLETPLHKSVYMMFLISEVHPFADGNGRTARIMMNAELVAGGEQKIIIPIVYRNNYLSALKAMTHNSNPIPLIRMLDFAQRYTQAIQWQEFDIARSILNATHAFMDANEAEEEGVRLVLPRTYTAQ